MNREIFSLISAETILPLVALAAGVAGGIGWIWGRPQISSLKTEIESHAIQIKAWSDRLQEAEKTLDAYRDKLKICKETMLEANERIRELEATIKEDHDHPLP